MSEEGKEIIRRLSDTIPMLDREKQNYILGIVEGMVIMSESRKAEPDKVPQAV